MNEIREFLTGQTMVVYTAQSGSPSQAAFDQLARGITERAATR